VLFRVLRDEKLLWGVGRLHELLKIPRSGQWRILFVCALHGDMFLHGQAREGALEEAIVPGCIVHAAVRRHAHWPQLRGSFIIQLLNMFLYHHLVFST
jgi:hypothetical protein